MNLTATNKLETNKYELEIEVNATDFEAAVEKAFHKAKKNISVPGFRTGKAPRKMIEKVYGEGAFYDDAVNALYPQVISDAVLASGLDIVDRPDVEVVSISKEDGVKMKAICTTSPEVEVSNYKGIEVTKIVNDVTDEAVLAEIEIIREKGVRIITIEDRAAQTGDEVVIDFEGFLDNVAFEGGKADNFTLALGGGQFIPGFEEQVAGHNIDEEFDVNVTFPEDYQSADLAGKPVVFKIKLHEIKAKELPDVDDEFVKDATEFNTVDELKADIKSKLEDAELAKADNDVENKIIDAVVENMTAEIPQVMFEQRIDEMVHEFEHRLSSQGMNIEVYLQYTGMQMDSFRKTFAEQAEKQVKLRLALVKISEVENIAVSDEDIDAEYAKLAEQYKMEIEKIKSYIASEDLKKDIAVAKTVEFIKAEAVIK